MPEELVDVLICGSGSAGLCAAVWLARAGINFKVLESRSGPLVLGQADGVQCRTVEIFESLGIERRLVEESYHVNELAFWVSDGKGIKSSSYTADNTPGLSHQPHAILNQARINQLLIDDINKSGASIEYGHQVCNVQVLGNVDDIDDYCTTVTSIKDGQEHVFRAKFVVGCDGAHSTVRKSLGMKMEGDSTNSMWGVMDVYPRTDFPDIRKKAILQSAAGNLMIIPREGDSLVRFYLEIEGSQTFDSLVEQAKRTFAPYSLEIAETVWWSTYSIGQRLADSFSVRDRVFLAGDACHTHSPKAGQGMNVSLQDGYNLGWKLAAFLKGRVSRSILATYVPERRQTAQDLIDFDRHFTKIFSSKYRKEHGFTDADFEDGVKKARVYTAGLATKYAPSIITQAGHETSTLKIGMRFPTARVVRWSDALAMQLVRAMPSEGQWHILVFAGDLHAVRPASDLQMVSKVLESLIRRFTVGDLDDIFNILLVSSSRRLDVQEKDIPRVFFPVTGEWKMKNLHKVFFDDESYYAEHGKAYEYYGLTSGIVIVRPDQYVAKILSMDEVATLHDFFGAFMMSQNKNGYINGHL